MKKTTLSLFVLAALVAPFSATAAPLNPSESTSRGLPTGSAALPAAPNCAESLDDLVAELQRPDYGNQIAANSTLISNGTALAESCGASQSFCVTDGRATYSGAEIVGTSKVGEPAKTQRSVLAFRIVKSAGKAKMKWKIGGKAHTGTVDSCVGRIWTATSGTSAIAVHLGEAAPVPQ